MSRTLEWQLRITCWYVCREKKLCVSVRPAVETTWSRARRRRWMMKNASVTRSSSVALVPKKRTM
jgi:hypothetical protein